MLLALALLGGFNLAGDFKSDLRTCGIDEARAIVEHSDEPEDRETGIAGSAPVSDRQMSCIAGAAARREYFIEFADPALNKRFLNVVMTQMRETGRSMAREWLAQRDLLDKLPVFDGDLASFAVRTEQLCGFAPHTGLRLLGPKSVTLADSLRPDASNVECLVMVFAATDLKEGISFGFIGNEAYEPPRL